jgi:hypothetical protein
MVHTCNPSTRKEEAEGLGTQGHLQIQKEFEANLGYVILSQKKKKKNNKLKQNVSLGLGEPIPSQY